MSNNKGIARAKKDTKRSEAIERQTARDARTDLEQHEKLVAAGHGHCGEALSLLTKIEAAA